MDDNTQPADNAMLQNIEQANLLLIVVGAHLRAEALDRPLAYRLCDHVQNWLNERAERLNIGLLPLVCSDIWYVNHPPLHKRPTITVGEPGVNALSAYLADRLNPALVRDERLLIQLDPDFVDLRVSIWGSDYDLTAEAMDLFISKYLEAYLTAVATQVEPEHG